MTKDDFIKPPNITNLDVPFMFILCGIETMHLTSDESLAVMIYGENQGCGGEACNI